MKNVVESSHILLEKYNKLPQLHKRIMQLIALLFRVDNRSDLFDCITCLEMTASCGRRLSVGTIIPILRELIAQNLLVAGDRCNPLIMSKLTLIALADENPNAEENLKIIFNTFPNSKTINFSERYLDDVNNIRALHIAIHTNDTVFFIGKQTEIIDYCFCLITLLINMTQYLYLDVDWIKTRHEPISAFVCCAMLRGYYDEFIGSPPDIKNWLEYYNENIFVNAPAAIHNLFLELDIEMGRFDYVKKRAEFLPADSPYLQEAMGAIYFFKEDFATAMQYYKKSLRLFKQQNRKKVWFRFGINGLLHIILLLIEEKDPLSAMRAVRALKKLDIAPFACIDLFQVLVLFASGDIVQAKNTFVSGGHVLPIDHAVSAWIDYLLFPERWDSNAKNYKQDFFDFLKANHLLIAHFFAELVLAKKDDKECLGFLSQSPFGNFRFLKLFKAKQQWEQAIDQLAKIIDYTQEHSKEKNVASKRMVWIFNPDSMTIDVAEQQLRKDGSWTGGRAIALKRLYQRDQSLKYITEQDVEAINGLRRETFGWYNQEHYYWNLRITLPALIGHPLLFHSDNIGMHLELQKGQLVLQIAETKDGYHISLPYNSEFAKTILEKETDSRYKIIDFSEQAAAISQIVTKAGITVPKAAKEKIIALIQNAKQDILIHADVDDDSIPTVLGNTICTVHLFPLGGGLKVNLRVRPFRDQGPYFRPGHGQKNVIAAINSGQGEIRQKVLRDFSEELKGAKNLIDFCQTLQQDDLKTDEWHIEDISTCLEFLLEIENFKKKHQLDVEWPKGETFKVKKTVSFNNLSLAIKGVDYWFEYDGKVDLDDGQVLGMRTLLDLLNNSYGRFVKLADGEFIALTTEFQRKLDELKSIANNNRVFYLGADVLHDLAQQVKDGEYDSKWQEHLNKIQAMKNYKPKIPTTLQAKLRDYQCDGYYYLSRMTKWEIGCCLADDMGLGKTLQAIAVLLENAKHGACLVIAPTSVGFVWQEEVKKFAPTLNIHILDNASRESKLESLTKMDLLVCSYGLLQQAGDLLAKKFWEVVVLDEAQAIKNSNTKRWKAAMNLQCKRRLALTGTPIENHLGELWSIFRFLNPGLLGNLSSFQQRFAIPIEKYNDSIAKRGLKSLVAPYILRRTKSQVLDELPPKIEQTILIEPTGEEMAFYEAVRKKALEEISKLNVEQNNTRFNILAEISRLRQACCHSTLVETSLDIESTKIRTFLTILRNLLENNHRALVFSQFVRYLTIIKTFLDRENISYQYLDGSTPKNLRQKYVDAFQAGEGELFLLSLRAGGTGLNLTAADYVIHLDPWWNPAVEDQASDRVHRIGQQRPVTVYRLITKNTIEEKIINLHKNKRDLAMDLLSGNNIIGKLSAEELVDLIKG